MEIALGCLVAAVLGVPLLLGLAGLPARGRLFTATYCRAGGWGTAFVSLAAVLVGLSVWWSGPIDWSFVRPDGWPVGFGVYVDTLSALMLVLTAGIGFVTCRYSARSLDGVPGQARFLAWTLLTLSAVLCLLCSRNLLAFMLCWCAVSCGLHRLLTFFSDRPAARRAAWKKFVISRIGDACLLGAVALAWSTYGTLEFPELFRLAAPGEGGPRAAAMAVLLVLGAMTKSAQFPFHTWLPETMESPTPVSALMHAGVINAGGYLIVRLSPLVAQSPLAMDVLMVNGALTAMLGSVVLLTQTDVKRSLAYSTVSQMGFMMMQCGLGAFSAAVLHIVTHGLYKAHAFLATGAAASWSAKRPELSFRRAVLVGCAALAVSAATVSLGLVAAGGNVWTKPGGAVIATFLTAGVAVLTFRALSDPTAPAAGGILVAATGLPLVLGYLGAWNLIDAVLAPFLNLSRHQSVPSAFDNGFCLVVAVVTLAALFVGWAGRPLANTLIGHRLYVLALNGFYLADLLRRPFASWHVRPVFHRRHAA